MNYFICTSHHVTPLGRNELNKLTSLPTCGYIAQLVEHRTGIAEVTGSNPVEALIFFRLLLSNCLNWILTAMIILHLELFCSEFLCVNEAHCSQIGHLGLFCFEFLCVNGTQCSQIGHLGLFRSEFLSVNGTYCS